MPSAPFRRSLLCCVALVACRPAQAPETPLPEPTHSDPRIVRLAPTAVAHHALTAVEASLRPLRASFDVPARVAFDGDTTALVGALARGRVVELPVAIGARVAQGDVLAWLDSTELGEAQNELLMQRRAVATAVPLVALSRQVWERGQQLFDATHSVSNEEVLRRELDYRTALGNQQRAESSATAARQRLRLLGMDEAAIEEVVQKDAVQSRQPLRATRAGQVVERRAMLGAVVGPEQPALFTLIDPSRVWVLAEVPEARLADVVLGSEAAVRPTYADHVVCTGTLTFLAPKLDASTRTAQARIEVRDPPPMLRAGVSCDVRLQIADERPAAAEPRLVVPETAVQTFDRQSVVFVPIADEPGAFTMRRVEIGRPVDGLLPVLAGLQPGERVVADGAFVLKAQAVTTAAATEK